MFGNVSDREGIYYANDERGVLWEFYLSRPFAAGGDGDGGEVRFHYVVNYEFERPGVFVVEWLDVDDAHADLGGRASVGMQGGELFFLSFFFFLLCFFLFFSDGNSGHLANNVNLQPTPTMRLLVSNSRT